MRFDLVTIFPQMFDAVARSGVTGRALDRGLWSMHCWNPRDFTTDPYRRVDDRPYGGGPGMVLAVEPLRSTIRAARERADGDATVSLLSPQGRLLDQAALLELSQRPELILVCGRYEGIDERVIELEIDEEWSIGDYVLSGGELAAAVVIDAVTRLLPGVLGDEQSAAQDSFAGGLLDCQHYTRPEEYEGLTVPPVLLSGDHAAIDRWRRKQALGRTWLRRPDLLRVRSLDDEERMLLAEFQAEYDESAETVRSQQTEREIE